MKFQVSSLSNVARPNISSLASSKVKNVENSKVTNAADFAVFALRVADSTAAEVVSSDNLTNVVTSIKAYGSSVKNTEATKLAPFFQAVKNLAVSVGALHTANAITTAAAWYYKNIEKPASRKSGSSVSSSVSVAEETTETVPLTQREWFFPALALGTALVIGTAIIFWPADKI